MTRYYFTNELYHHGIKGQKWGVRRYRNEDGTLTEAGKKRYQKENYKTLKKLSKEGDNEKIKSFIKEQASFKDLREKRNKWQKLEDKAVRFEDTEYADKADEEGYRQTLNYFRKTDPQYLKEMIEQNGGREDNLDLINHDFRRFQDGFWETAWDDAREEYYKQNPEMKEIIKKADEAWKDYWNTMGHLGENITNDILGKYGNRLTEDAKKRRTITRYKDLVMDAVNELENSPEY